jgi:hypothetical protein
LIRRLNVMRFGYTFMGVGLAVVKWPLLLDLGSLPVMDGVVTSIQGGRGSVALM